MTFTQDVDNFITEAVYFEAQHRLLVRTKWGFICLDVNQIDELKHVSVKELRTLRFSPWEPSIHVECADVDINLNGLMLSLLENMRREIDPEGLFK